MRARRRMLSRAGGKALTSTRRSASCQGEDGFTLIELVIVIIILPILVGGMAAALIAILQDEGTTFNRVANSADAQTTSAFFVRDVQNATSLTTGSPSSPTSGTCANTAFPPTGSTPLLSLQWGETNFRTIADGIVAKTNPGTLTSNTADFTPADIGATVSGIGIQSGTTITVIDTSTMVTLSLVPNSPEHGDTVSISLSSNWEATYWDVPNGSTHQLVRMFCDVEGSTPFFSSQEFLAHDLPANQGPATITCGPTIPASQCTPSNLATKWVATAGMTDVSISAAEPASGYEFDLSATPRSSNPASENMPAGAAVASSVLVTGPSISIPNSATLTVNGELAFNSPSGAAAGAGTLDDAAGPISEYNCPLQSGACPEVTSSVADCNCSTPMLMGSPISPPVVSQPASPTGPTETCTGANVTCQPGYYTSPVDVSGNVTFASGNYLFSPGAGPVDVTGSGSVTFGAGQYTFEDGLAIGPNITVTGGGVFFYLATGSLTVSTGDSVNLTPATSGPYVGLLVYQPTSNSSNMYLGAGQPPTVNTFGGAIEAPEASVTLGSSNDDFTVDALVASTITLGSSNVTVTVGS